MSKKEELAEEYGLKVSRHMWERSPMYDPMGEPRPWMKRPDHTAVSAFKSGFDAGVQAAIELLRTQVRTGPGSGTIMVANTTEEYGQLFADWLESKKGEL